MKVICISGKAQHGKDTSAKFLKDILEKNGQRVLITHYGDLVKYIATTFFGWNGVKDEAGRTILQTVGTERVRNKVPNYWVKFVSDILYLFPDEWDYVLIPDCRFPNEVDYLREHGLNVTHVRVRRDNFDNGLTDEQKNHPSETSLDDVKPDYIFVNDGTLEDLEKQIDKWVRPFLLIANRKVCEKCKFAKFAGYRQVLCKKKNGFVPELYTCEYWKEKKK